MSEWVFWGLSILSLLGIGLSMLWRARFFWLLGFSALSGIYLMQAVLGYQRRDSMLFVLTLAVAGLCFLIGAIKPPGLYPSDDPGTGPECGDGSTFDAYQHVVDVLTTPQPGRDGGGRQNFQSARIQHRYTALL